MTDVLFNGGAVPDLSAHRGLNYGDGVFRTCLIYRSQTVDLMEHCNILNDDGARIGLAPVSVTEVAADAARLAAGRDRAVLKIVLMRADPGRGYRAASDAADRLVRAYPVPAYQAGAWNEGVTAFRSTFRLAPQPALAGIKHLNRLEQVMASRDWEEGADEALLGDHRDRPVCGTRTNLFWVRDGEIHTPALLRCGVSGFMRRRVLALANEAGIGARIRDDARWDELDSADEVFLTNSLVGIWPLARLGGRRWAAHRPVTRRLMELLAHPRWVKG